MNTIPRCTAMLASLFFLGSANSIAARNDNSVAACTGGAVAGGDRNRNPKVLFTTGFESPVKLKYNNKVTGGKRVYQDLIGPSDGSDSNFKIGSPSKVKGPAAYIQTVGMVFHNALEKGASYNGTKALRLQQNENTKPGPHQQGTKFNKMPAGPIYMEAWLKWDSDMLKRMHRQFYIEGDRSYSKWKTVFGIKTGWDYRIATYVHVDKNGKGYWHAHGDNNSNGSPVRPYPNGSCYSAGKLTKYWVRENKNFSVPLGKWFHLQVYIDRGDRNGNNGRFLQAVDGKVIHDYRGNLWPKIKDGTSFCGGGKAFKARTKFEHTTFPAQYGGGLPTKGKPIKQWVDDLAYYHSAPCGNLPCKPHCSGGNADTPKSACSDGKDNDFDGLVGS